MALIECRGLCKDWAGDQVFAGVNFAIQEGEKVGLVGRNGAGKTVKNGAANRVVGLQTVSHHVNDHIIRDQFAPIHNFCGLEPQIGSRLNLGTQDISGGDLRNSQMLGQPLRLSAFTDADGAEEH